MWYVNFIFIFIPSPFLINYLFQAYCPIQTGDYFLSQHFTMNTTYEYVGIDTGVLAAFLLFFVTLTFIGIKFINHLKR